MVKKITILAALIMMHQGVSFSVSYLPEQEYEAQQIEQDSEIQNINKQIQELEKNFYETRDRKNLEDASNLKKELGELEKVHIDSRIRALEAQLKARYSVVEQFPDIEIGHILAKHYIQELSRSDVSEALKAKKFLGIIKEYVPPYSSDNPVLDARKESLERMRRVVYDYPLPFVQK